MPPIKVRSFIYEKPASQDSEHSEMMMPNGDETVSMAYILIQSSPQKTLEVRKKLTRLKAVTEAYTLLNEYDLLAKVNYTGDSDEEAFLREVSIMDGILRVETLRINRD